MHAVIWIWETTLLSSLDCTWQIRDDFFSYLAVSGQQCIYFPFDITESYYCAIWTQRVSECTEEARAPLVWLNTTSPALLFCSVLKMRSQRAVDQTVSWDSEEHMVGREGKGEERKTREGEDRWGKRVEKYRALWLVRINRGILTNTLSAPLPLCYCLLPQVVRVKIHTKKNNGRMRISQKWQ